MLKILVVEDHALVREGLLQTLNGIAKNTKTFGASDSEGAIAKLDEHPDIDLILLDLMLPGLHGLSLLGVLRQRYPAIPVLVVSAMEETETVRKVLRNGASGFVGKSGDSRVLVGAVKTVLAGEIYVPERFAEEEAKPERESKVHLTPTQLRVLQLLTEGYSNREIADLLGVAVGTVKLHLFSAYKALDVSSRAQALIALKKHKIKL